MSMTPGQAGWQAPPDSSANRVAPSTGEPVYNLLKTMARRRNGERCGGVAGRDD